MAVTVLGKYLLLVTGFLTAAQVATTPTTINTYQPKEKYLQKWNEKVFEWEDFPKCKDVPQSSEEERNITTKCGKIDKTNLCLNIFLFAEMRDICLPFLQNLETFRNGLRDIVDEVGLEEFSYMHMDVIVEMLEKKTKMEIPYFVHKDMDSLVMDVLDEIATKAGFTKKGPTKTD